MVFINGCYDGANDSYVLMDDVQSGELLTQHLIDQGAYADRAGFSNPMIFRA